MAVKVEHFEAGAPGFVEKLNELVDAVNATAAEVENKQDKRKPASSK